MNVNIVIFIVILIFTTCQLSYVAEDEKGKIVGYVLAKMLIDLFNSIKIPILPLNNRNHVFNVNDQRCNMSSVRIWFPTLMDSCFLNNVIILPQGRRSRRLHPSRTHHVVG